MITEASLAAAVDAHLAAQGWEIFHEVTLEYQLRRRTPIGDGRADNVLTRGNRLAVNEIKVHLSFELFEQAERWLEYAHGVWITVPYASPDRGRLTAFRIARVFLGIGVFVVGDSGVRELHPPRWRDSISPELLQSLRPEHKTHALAGTNEGGQWTSTKETFAALAAYVAANKGCKLEEALAHIQHHYLNRKSAEASLRRHLRREAIPGVYSGWRKGLYPTREEARTSLGGT